MNPVLKLNEINPVLKLNKMTSPDLNRIQLYYRFLFCRMFHKLLCQRTLLQQMKAHPLHEKFQYDLYGSVFLEAKKQIHDYRIERYYLDIFDKNKDVVFKCIFIIKGDGVMWIDAKNTRNRYSCANVYYRAEGKTPQVMYGELVKTFLTWN